MKKVQSNSKKHLDRTWVEVDYDAIETNTKTLKGFLAPEIPLMAIVKSNAYGHGMVDSARAALRGGATWFGVDEITEAVLLRSAGIKAPILVLGYTLPDFYKLAVQKNISITISSLESLQNLAKKRFSKKLRIHLKFDTGLHRQGIPETHIQQIMRVIANKKFPAIIEGAYTHFAVMEDPMRQDYSKMQARNFKNAVAMLQAKGFKPITHASATSGILFSKDFYFGMVRAGIGIYGIWPSSGIKKWAEGIASFIPALSWKTIITEVKLVNKGVRVGYDLTYQIERPSRLAIIPVGYWHGLPRNMSNRGHVLVCGKKAAIIGRISMDMAIIDVTEIPSVKPGDEVVIIGNQADASITAEESAHDAGTINYEIVTRINPLITRIKA